MFPTQLSNIVSLNRIRFLMMSEYQILVGTMPIYMIYLKGLLEKLC